MTEATTPGAVYKGLAIASKGGATMLYAANFHTGKIDVFNDAFAPVTVPGGFVDPKLPADFAPFNVQEIAGRLVVAFAQQDPDSSDELHGPGLGYVDVFDTSGHLLRRLVSQGRLDAPWGLAVAPGTSGRSAGTCWSATSATGRSTPSTRGRGAFQGTLMNKDGNPIKVNGLWALRFGNGVIGTPQTLLFTAGHRRRGPRPLRRDRRTGQRRIAAAVNQTRPAWMPDAHQDGALRMRPGATVTRELGGGGYGAEPDPSWGRVYPGLQRRTGRWRISVRRRGTLTPRRPIAFIGASDGEQLSVRV